MRFFRNPIVTGILALVAVAMVFYRFVLPYLSSNGPQTIVPDSAPAANSAQARAVAAATALRAQMAEPAGTWQGPTIDRDYVEGRFAKWVAVPKRDPFLLLGVDPKDKEMQELLEPSPIAKWKLNAIWDQTGSRLAVINNSVHQVGDEIAGFKILRIESDEVWFQGPKRKERLGLQNRGPAVLLNPGFDSGNPQAEKAKN